MRNISQWWKGTVAYATLKAREDAGKPNLVDDEAAEARAAVCAPKGGDKCPENIMPTDQSWLERWANGRMRKRTDGAFTSRDGDLGVCRACSCELRSIVHFQPDLIAQFLAPKQAARLPAHCWKLKTLKP